MPNGAAARLVQRGDLVIIGSYAEFERTEIASHKPALVHVNDKNQITSIRSSVEPNTPFTP